MAGPTLTIRPLDIPHRFFDTFSEVILISQLVSSDASFHFCPKFFGWIEERRVWRQGIVNYKVMILHLVGIQEIHHFCKILCSALCVFQS
ncbi:hypothetical protein PHYBLDRAFT_158620 [Phycomyces blakesleeanus NRRL 1555(-)]|uniref:Uncharacterized protein n=1 Tax=Phycomyces blakesleeanus (strain ATCC 8743b / DSM 1359 / FGSC 10004 / NBRC 33097 / NRRL 1555) TaxID=763407 RepID=A0A167MV32_PHYB8|nr:hypothetical protein PHYBLDRAFT_158620 [Phycomyces blakesleeanus NRRL 1555(-)]OAD74104.1 hypothetical protein PHYBLDRAFT_158620 [Phycomyces blakesleeanus NRRL 1555(-)]|eukprot:XP_018292144.1 hypothetical protein PHYBLDRAFT_158620 [Phycomyces blakesleeanus NRRL 1555(-)]